MSQLETLAQLPHSGYNLNPHTHLSVTEWELCEEGHQAALDEQNEAERYAENAIERYYEGGWDPMGTYAAESLLTAGGQTALHDPQAHGEFPTNQYEWDRWAFESRIQD